MKRAFNLIVFGVVALFIMLGVVAYYWQSDNRFYEQAVTPVVEESRERDGINKRPDPVSAQPTPYGLREKDIKKQEGHGYRTY